MTGDGQVSFADIFRTLRYVAGSTPDGFDPVHADLNRDGRVNEQDVLLILRGMF